MIFQDFSMRAFAFAKENITNPNLELENSKQEVNFKANKAFDIIYINLDREEKRDNHMKKLLSKANCEFSRFAAVDGVEIYNERKTFEDYCKAVNLTNIQNIIGDHKKIEEKFAGMTGCKLSHYLLKRLIEQNNIEKPVLILEDDADLEYDFIDRIEEALQELPKNWDILLINNFSYVSNDHYNQSSKLTVYVKYFTELVGYLVNGSSSAKKIADLIQNRCAALKPIDIFYAECASIRSLNVLALKKKQVIQRRDLFRSSIPTSGGINVKTLIKPISKTY